MKKETVDNNSRAVESSIKDCIFCMIAGKLTPADVVLEDEETIYFHDISPKARVHVVGIPKKHLVSLAQIDQADQAVIGRLHVNVATVAKRLGIDESGYRIVANVGSDSGQEVKHLHWHVLGGEALGRMVSGGNRNYPPSPFDKLRATGDKGK